MEKKVQEKKKEKKKEPHKYCIKEGTVSILKLSKFYCISIHSIGFYDFTDEKREKNWKFES